MGRTEFMLLLVTINIQLLQNEIGKSIKGTYQITRSHFFIDLTIHSQSSRLPNPQIKPIKPRMT